MTCVGAREGRRCETHGTSISVAAATASQQEVRVYSTLWPLTGCTAKAALQNCTQSINFKTLQNCTQSINFKTLQNYTQSINFKTQLYNFPPNRLHTQMLNSPSNSIDSKLLNPSHGIDMQLLDSPSLSNSTLHHSV